LGHFEGCDGSTVVLGTKGHHLRIEGEGESSKRRKEGGREGEILCILHYYYYHYYYY